jgi:hypothetical protein
MCCLVLPVCHSKYSATTPWAPAFKREHTVSASTSVPYKQEALEYCQDICSCRFPSDVAEYCHHLLAPCIQTSAKSLCNLTRTFRDCRYQSKASFREDIDLIASNCHEYNEKVRLYPQRAWQQSSFKGELPLFATRRTISLPLFVRAPIQNRGSCL